ncbi:MAG: DegV family EDD domain-containing protein, partial [Anaerolineales bacterium]|nr:DegV family EDD domain-containing protein [Anaerolineales bacterium]
MPQVSIVTDSAASIPELMLKELNIQTVAYYIHRGGEALRDLVTVQRDEFLRWMMTATTLPTTASPGPGDYIETYRGLIGRGIRNILSIHMTAKGSGAFQAASIARDTLRDESPGTRIEVVDTRNVSLCQGWMAIEAAANIPWVVVMVALGSGLTVLFWARWAGLFVSGPQLK